MDRVARILIVTLMVGIGSFILFGGFGRASGFVLVLPLVLLGGGVRLLRRSGNILENRWSGRGDPASAQPLVPPVPKPAATRREVTLALAGAESRAWLASPWFAAAFAFCALSTVLFGWVFSGEGDDHGSWAMWFILFPIMAHPAVGMAVVGAHHAATRDRRDGCDELFVTCPADETQRTSALLTSAWVPAALVAGFVVVSTLLFSIRSHALYGSIKPQALGDVAAAIVLAVGGVALGVALARWARFVLVPVVFVAVLVPVIVTLGNLGAPHWSNLRQLSTWPRYPDHDLLFADRRVWSHLLWLATLAGLMAVIAIAHSRRDRRIFGVGLAVLAVCAGAGAAEARPMSSSHARHIASLIASPATHQSCRSVDRVEVCVYRGYEGYGRQTLAHAAPVAAAAPTSVVASVSFRQIFDGNRNQLGPEVNRLLSARAQSAGRHAPLEYGTTRGAMNAVRLRTAFTFVGLPLVANRNDAPMVIAGQSRGVVALWLAARGLSDADARNLASSHFDEHDVPEKSGPSAFDRGNAWPDPCDGGAAPVAWAEQDLIAARALLAKGEANVRALLARDWARLTARATTTDELMQAAGLPPVGPPDKVIVGPSRCSY